MKIISKIALFIFISLLLSCSAKLKEEDKIFHAAPNQSGFGGTFFSLYKNNKYEFCDGDFMDPGCYTGDFRMNGDTLTLMDLKLNDHVKNNRFIIYRFNEQDSTYWLNKYPKSNVSWEELRESDYSGSNDGDVYELDENDKPRTNVKYWYVIRLDETKHNR